MHSAMTLSRITAFAPPFLTPSKNSFAFSWRAGSSATRYRTMALVSGRLLAGLFTDGRLPRPASHLPHGDARLSLSRVLSQRTGRVPHRSHHDNIIRHFEIDGAGLQFFPDLLGDRHLPLARNLDRRGRHLISPYFFNMHYFSE